eukprot:GHVL01042294.1.p1 GENE.GHVL01042294.1~~GHVL01042294.1.p1  ORF type:complete len:138 (-),score=2.13 GHVL01042294.1:159-572(-)
MTYFFTFSLLSLLFSVSAQDPQRCYSAPTICRSVPTQCQNAPRQCAVCTGCNTGGSCPSSCMNCIQYASCAQYIPCMEFAYCQQYLNQANTNSYANASPQRTAYNRPSYGNYGGRYNASPQRTAYNRPSYGNYGGRY